MHHLVLDWAKTLPAWQSDAVRRLATQPRLTESDEAEILELLRAAHGFSSSRQAQPLAMAPPAQIKAKKIRLRALKDLAGVNALAPNQTLEFLVDGMTVVYGDNGAGKSGYARVLKRACRARDASVTIEPNVFAQGAQPSPSATFELDVEGKPYTFPWPDATNPSKRIPGVAVFDSRCSSIYVDKDNEIDFLPGGLDVFDRLSQLQVGLKERIDKELSALPPLPIIFSSLTPGTSAAVFAQNLSADTSISEVEAFLTFPAEQREELAAVRKLLAEMSTSNPAARIEQLRLQARRLERYEVHLTTLDNQLGESAAARVRRLQSELRELETAAALTTRDSFGDGFLTGTGGAAWKVLFQAAERFAMEEAFPGQSAAEAPQCVLCQQPLESDAAARMRRFRSFVSGDVSQRLNAAKSQLEITLAGLPSVFGTLDAEQMSADVGDQGEVLMARLREFDERNAALRDPALTLNNLTPNGELAAWLRQRAEELLAEADELSKRQDPVVLAQKRREVLELGERERIASNASEIRLYHQGLVSGHRLRSCNAALAIRSITDASKKISGIILDKRLREAFQGEVTALAEERLAVEMKQAGKAGQAVMRVHLKGRKTGKAPVSGVLSEGEQKVVGLAAFFAELESGTFHCAILDDPVTSLDHEFQELVARRIAKCARTRQVVVFTHDVYFANLLQEEATRYKCAFAMRSVLRRPEGIGVVGTEADLDWHNLSVGKRVGRLRQYLQSKRALTGPDREMVAHQAGCRLRAAWERVVEELLLKRTVLRYRRSVETNRLQQIDLRPADLEAVQQAMTELSRLIPAHDAPQGVGVRAPSFDELGAMIDTLDAFVQELSSRKSTPAKTRQAAG